VGRVVDPFGHHWEIGRPLAAQAERRSDDFSAPLPDEVLSAMLFMVIEHFRSGRAPDIYRRFRDRGRMAPDGLHYVASWVDLNFERCFQVMETDDEALFKEWTANWEDLVEFEIVPVRTSAEAAASIEYVRGDL
jgi:hypothetical protein